MKRQLVATGLLFCFLVSLAAWLMPAPTPVRPPELAQPRVLIDVRDSSLERFAPAWQKEVERRFDHAVVALCHGGDIIHGQWIVENYGGAKFLTVEDLIAEEHKEYPGRTIVLLCCNPHHDILHGHPDVFYSTGSVWCVPDRAALDDGGEGVLGLNRWDQDTTVLGNIFEFANGE